MNTIIAGLCAVVSVSGFNLVIYGIACLFLTLRHRLPDIPVAWVIKTAFAGANFDARGLTLQRRGRSCILIGILAAILGIYAAAKAIPFQPNKPKGPMGVMWLCSWGCVTGIDLMVYGVACIVFARRRRSSGYADAALAPTADMSHGIRYAVAGFILFVAAGFGTYTLTPHS